MVSERPRSDRCGAKVVENIGLEIELEDVVITDDVFDAVLLSDGEHRIEGEPTYSEIREHLWDDYDPIAVAVTNVDDLESDLEEFADGDDVGAEMTVGVPGTTDEHTWCDVRPDYVNVTNRTSTLEGYCERWPLNGKRRCYVHHNNDEGPGEGNTHAMTHGLYAQRSNYYNALDDQDKQFVEALVDSWIEQAPFDRDAVGMVNDLYRCAIDQHRAWGGIDDFVTDDGEIMGLTKEVEQFNDDGEKVEVEVEQPVNLAYSRLANDVRQQLKDLGVYDSPEKQQAEATESLAKKLSGAGDD